MDPAIQVRPVYVQKNDSSATVQAAYLLAAGTPGYTMQDGDVTLDGTSLSFSPADSVVGNFGVNSVWTDVTSIVAPVVDAAPAGNVEFTAAEPFNTDSIDGEILAVIMNDPTLPTDNTVSFLFGALDTTGDNFSIGLASPLNLSDPNLSMTMSIGDSYSYQGPPGDGQYSEISVDGTLMTSSAGGNDDSICKYDTPQDFQNCGNGELMTVGGIGDSTDDPTDPTATDETCGTPGPPRCDDELYNLLPFVHNGDTSVQVNTVNPSNDDNIFFTGFQLDSTAAVVGEGAVLTPLSGSNPVGSPYTFSTKVQDDSGNPIADQPVTFTVLSGPDAGLTGSATTDASGDASFTYTGEAAGTDTVQVSFTDSSGNSHTSNEATVDWTAAAVAAPTTLTTSLSGASQTGTAITVPEGTSVTDAATLGGANAATAGGTVTYAAYSDDACTVPVGSPSTVDVTDGSVLPSIGVTFSNPGTYYWQASYSGDPANAPSSSTCGSETVTVTSPPPPPTVAPTTITTHLLGTGIFGGGRCSWKGDRITVFSGTTVTDSATLSGANVSTAGGTVTYTVYSGSTWAKRHLVANAGTFPVTDGVAPSSSPVTLKSTGTYYWQATYTGDPSNGPSASGYGSEVESVIPVPHCQYGWNWGWNACCKPPPRK